jgi:hypothetical protein
LGKTNYEIEIAEPKGHFVVVWQGKPVSVIKHHYYSDIKHYTKTGFAYRGHADRLAAKLNHMFDTEDFTVIKVL